MPRDRCRVPIRVHRWDYLSLLSRQSHIRSQGARPSCFFPGMKSGASVVSRSWLWRPRGWGERRFWGCAVACCERRLELRLRRRGDTCGMGWLYARWRQRSLARHAQASERAWRCRMLFLKFVVRPSTCRIGSSGLLAPSAPPPPPQPLQSVSLVERLCSRGRALGHQLAECSGKHASPRGLPSHSPRQVGATWRGLRQ